MKISFAHAVALALGMAWFSNQASAQQYYQQPSLLPIPAATQTYPVTPVANNELWDDSKAPPASPSDAPSILPPPPMAQPDHSVLGGSDFHKAAKGNWGDNNVVYEDGAACGPQGCGTPCQNFWYGSVGAVIMTREQQNSFLITGDTNGTRLLCSCQLDMDFTAGIDVTLGRTFNCGNNAIQFTYWSLNPATCDTTAYASTLGAQLVSGIDFTGATYNGNPCTDLSVGGFMQQGVVRQQYSNLEANLLGQCWGNGFIGGYMSSCQGGLCSQGGCGNGYCGPRWGCGWMMGIRYFEFDNGFSFNADGADEVWNDDADEFCFHVNLKNRLVGFQLGGGWNWSIFNCLQVYGLAKAGLYNNSIESQMSLHGAGGTGTFGDGSAIDCLNTANRLALIGQADLGLRYNIGCHFSVNAGYRIMTASGVALYEHNIPTDFNDSYYAQRIESDGSLLLHGAYIGGEFRF